MGDNNNKHHRTAALSHDLRPATPADQHTTILHLPDDVLGMLYAHLNATDRRHLAHAHPTFWKSAAVNSQIQRLCMDPSLPTPIHEQLETFPRNAPCLKTLSMNRVDGSTLKLLKGSSTAAHARLSAVECLNLEHCTMTTECVQPLLDLFTHLREKGGTLRLNKCRVPSECLSVLGPHMRIRELVCTECDGYAKQDLCKFVRAIASFKSLQKLALAFPVPVPVYEKMYADEEVDEGHVEALADLMLPDVWVSDLRTLGELRTLTLSNCVVVGLGCLLDWTYLQNLRLQGRCRWIGENYTVSKQMDWIESPNLREVYFGMMNPELAFSFEAFLSELPALETICVGSIDLAGLLPGKEDSLMRCLSSLPNFCTKDDCEVRICKNTQGLLGSLMHLLRGKRVVIVVTSRVSPQTVEQLSCLSQVVKSLHLKARDFSGGALIQAARLKGLLSIGVVRVTGQVLHQVPAALLAAALRHETFCLHMDPKRFDGDDGYAEGCEMEHMSYLSNVSLSLSAQWSHVRRVLPSAALVELKIEGFAWVPDKQASLACWHVK